MSRSFLLNRASFTIVLICLFATEPRLVLATKDGAKDTPNILFIVVDDLRPTLGCYGDKIAVTPNIDKFASCSAQFQHAFAQQALCGPSRTSFLTSRRPDTLHLYDFYHYWRQTVGNFTTLPQYFKDKGYHAFSIGKVFDPSKTSNHSDDYPYSWSEKPYHPSTQQYKMAKVCPNPDGTRHMNLLCPVDVKTQPEGTLPDIQSVQRAVTYLKDAESNPTLKPFFLAVGLHKPHIPLKYPKDYLDLYPLSKVGLAPHPKLPLNMPRVAYNPWTDLREREDVQALNLSFPWQPPPKLFQRQIRRNYYAATSYMDDLLGILLMTLETTRFSNNTIVFLIGDHGWSLGEHSEWSKYSNFDVALRVPFLIRIPGLTDQDCGSRFTYTPLISRNLIFKQKFKHLRMRHFKRRENPVKRKNKYFLYQRELVELVDVFPTLVDLAGFEPMPSCAANRTAILCTEGKSVAPLLLHKSNKKGRVKFSEALSQYPRPTFNPQENSDKPNLSDIRIMGYSIRTEKYRYTEWLDFDNKHFRGNFSNVYAKELYDLRNDPYESVNKFQVPRFSNVVKKMARKLRRAFKEA